jgi:hypothetical protein
MGALGWRLVGAVGAFVVAALLVLLLGIILITAGAAVPTLVAIGEFAKTYCWIFGLGVGLLYFASGQNWFGRRA